MVQLLPWLERFDKVYLWLDDDEAGREGAAKLVAKLGRSRCMLVRPLPDVNREGRPPKVWLRLPAILSCCVVCEHALLLVVIRAGCQ